MASVEEVGHKAWFQAVAMKIIPFSKHILSPFSHFVAFYFTEKDAIQPIESMLVLISPLLAYETFKCPSFGPSIPYSPNQFSKHLSLAE